MDRLLSRGPDAVLSTVTVSSTFEKNQNLYGKQFLLDGDEQTCWSSAPGKLPATVVFVFSRPVQFTSVVCQFQGGFVPRMMDISVASADEKTAHAAGRFYPEDSNKEQRFQLPVVEAGARLQLTIPESSDPYGRVVCYRLDVYGRLAGGSARSVKSAVLASLLGDSLSLGVHWCYDREQIARHVGGSLHGLLPPTLNSYHAGKQAGELTHYGDQSLILLDHLSAAASFDPSDFSQFWLEHMRSPSWKGYTDRASRTTIENMTQAQLRFPACGSGSSDFAGASSRVGPLLAFHGRHLPSASREAADRFVQDCRDATAVTHNNAGVVASSELLARACLRLLSSASDEALSPASAVCDAFQDLSEADQQLLHPLVEPGLQSLHDSDEAAAELFGLSCPLSSALPLTLHFVAKYPNDLQKALVENAMIGGDQAARAMAIGLLLGLSVAPESLPWLESLKARSHVDDVLRRLQVV